MPDHSNLLQKYNRASAHLSILYDQLEKKTAELEELRESQVRQDKVTRTLCETILRKEQDVRTDEDKKKGAKGESPWFTYSTIKLLEKAQESYEHSFKESVDEKKNFVSQYNKKMKALNEIIQNTIEDMRALEEELKKVSKEKAELEKNISEGKYVDKKDTANGSQESKDDRKWKEAKEKGQKTYLGHTQVHGAVVDEEEMLAMVDEDIDKIQTAAGNNKKKNKFPVTPSAKRVLDAKETAEEKKQAEKDEKKQTESRNQEFEELLSTMPENMKKIFLCIGEKGISEFNDLIGAVGDGISGAKIRACLPDLERKELLKRETLNLPLTTKLTVFWLSGYGKRLYKHITGKEPAESKAEKIKKEHTTLEHGYSIADITRLINQSNYAKNMNAKASCIRDRKQIKLPDGKAFVPDITITSEDKVLMYIEYETTKCTEADFIDKCSKFVQVSDNLNFIVPGKNEVEILKGHAEKWLEIAKKKKIFSKPITIRVGTPRGIKTADNDNKNADNLAWEWEKRINAAKPRQ